MWKYTYIQHLCISYMYIICIYIYISIIQKSLYIELYLNTICIHTFKLLIDGVHTLDLKHLSSSPRWPGQHLEGHHEAAVSRDGRRTTRLALCSSNHSMNKSEVGNYHISIYLYIYVCVYMYRSI